MSRPSVNPAAQPSEDPAARPPRPLGVVIAAVLLAAEALALAAAGIWYIVNLLTQPAQSLAAGIFMVVLLFALAAGMGAVSVNLFKGFRWTRSAAFVWQLLMVSVAVPVLLGGEVLTGLALLLPPLIIAFFLFTPKVVAFTLRTGGAQPML